MYLDFIAGIFELLGIWKIGDKKSYGFLLCLICNVLWIVYVLVTKSAYGLLLVVIPAMFINIRNYLRWNKQGVKNEVSKAR